MMPILLLNWLVVYLPPENYESQIGSSSKKNGENHIHVPNHQPVLIYDSISITIEYYPKDIYILYIYYIYIVDEPNIGSQDPNRIPGKDAQWR